MKLQALLLVLASTAGLTALSGCDSNGAEEAGETIDEAADDAGDAVEEAADEVEDAVDDK